MKPLVRLLLRRRSVRQALYKAYLQAHKRKRQQIHIERHSWLPSKLTQEEIRLKNIENTLRILEDLDSKLRSS